jgi:hypothetical protein
MWAGNRQTGKGYEKGRLKKERAQKRKEVTENRRAESTGIERERET